MGRMIRKQIYIEPEQEAMLKRQAKELGVTEAELIRKAIDRLDQVPGGFPAELDLWEREKAYIREHRMPMALAHDRRAWEEAKAFIEQRMKVVAPQTGRGWTREELYDERLKRFSD